MNNTNMKLSAPWDIFAKRMRKLFEGDSDITIEHDDTDIPMIRVLVDSQDKYEALTKLLPSIVEFGNVKILINVVPSNKEKTYRELFETLFEGNPAFSNVIGKYVDVAGKVFAEYVMFKPKIAQYYADNLMDPYGNNNELYANIAKDVFRPIEGIRYGTDIIDDRHWECEEQ